MQAKQKIQLLLISGIMLALALACNAITGGGKPSPSGNSGASEVDASAAGSSIQVTEGEFNVTIEPSQPVAGEVTFVVRNEGHIPHDFRIYGNGVDHRTPKLEAGGTDTFTVSLEAGTYSYECTVEGHAMLGMQGTFKVQVGSTN